MILFPELHEKYLDMLLKDLGFEKASVEEQARVLEAVSSRFEQVVMVTLLSLLSEEQRERLKEALGQPESLEDTVTLLAAEIPGLDQILEQALVEEYKVFKLNLG